MYQNDAIGQNMIYVNDMLVRVFKLLLAGIAVIIILKASGIIVLPWLYLIIPAGIGTVVCLLPIASRDFRMDGNMVKYINVSCAAVLCISGYCFLNMDVIILLVIPIGFACLYFDIKLIKYSSVLSIAGLILREVLSSLTNWGFAEAAKGSNIRVALYPLQFGIAAALLIAVSKRGLSILSNAHSYYKNINNIFSNINASSQSLESAEDMLQKGISALNVNEEEEVLSQNTMVNGIISNINKSVENAREIMKYTKTLQKSNGKGLNSDKEVAARIEEYSRNTKELVLKLSGYTNKITEDLSLISLMIDESRLLSINSAAEAESASIGDRGSAIIAMKVEKLAEKSAESATNIQKLLESIVNDAENTVKTVAEIYEEVFKSLELINRTVETLVKWLMYKNMK